MSNYTKTILKRCNNSPQQTYDNLYPITYNASAILYNKNKLCVSQNVSNYTYNYPKVSLQSDNAQNAYNELYSKISHVGRNQYEDINIQVDDGWILRKIYYRPEYGLYYMIQINMELHDTRIYTSYDGINFELLNTIEGFMILDVVHCGVHTVYAITGPWSEGSVEEYGTVHIYMGSTEKDFTSNAFLEDTFQEFGVIELWESSLYYDAYRNLDNGKNSLGFSLSCDGSTIVCIGKFWNYNRQKISIVGKYYKYDETATSIANILHTAFYHNRAYNMTEVTKTNYYRNLQVVNVRPGIYCVYSSCSNDGYLSSGYFIIVGLVRGKTAGTLGHLTRITPISDITPFRIVGVLANKNTPIIYGLTSMAMTGGSSGIILDSKDLFQRVGYISKTSFLSIIWFNVVNGNVRNNVFDYRAVKCSNNIIEFGFGTSANQTTLTYIKPPLPNLNYVDLSSWNLWGDSTYVKRVKHNHPQGYPDNTSFRIPDYEYIDESTYLYFEKANNMLYVYNPHLVDSTLSDGENKCSIIPINI